jgi:hypothetical protein
MSRSSIAGWMLAALVCSTGAARAQPEEQPPPSLEPTGPPDALLQAVRDRDVTLHLRDGGEIYGRILGWDANTITLARLPSNEVMLFTRRDVLQVSLGGAMQPPPQQPPQLLYAPPVDTGPPPKPRYFALEFALAPAIDLDLDVGMFHAFANASLIFPMATDGTLLAFAVGAGVSLRFRKTSNWSLDIFGHIVGARFNEFGVVGFGFGLGAHHTWRNGLTIGFAAPMLGYSGQVNNPSPSSGGSNVGYYYLAAEMGLPMTSIGYRF